MHQIEGERNFHMFYQLLRGASVDERATLWLADTVDHYNYLATSSHDSMIPNVSDEDQFPLTRTCMTSIGIGESTQIQIFRLLAGILNLGNVQFQEDPTEGIVTDIKAEAVECMEKASALLGVAQDALVASIIKHNMYVSGATIVKPQLIEQVRDSLDPVTVALL